MFTNFNVLKNTAGEFMIILPTMSGKVSDPRIECDGGAVINFIKDNEKISMGYIHPAIRKELKTKEKVLVVETRDGCVINEYNVRIVPVRKIDV